MKKLPTQFEDYDEQFDQLCRTEKTALYRRTTRSGRLSYEVAVIRLANQKRERHDGCLESVPCEPYECYPSSEEWGDRGWTYTSEEAAREKYASLSETVRNQVVSSRTLRCRKKADGDPFKTYRPATLCVWQDHKIGKSNGVFWFQTTDKEFARKLSKRQDTWRVGITGHNHFRRTYGMVGDWKKVKRIIDRYILSVPGPNSRHPRAQKPSIFRGRVIGAEETRGPLIDQICGQMRPPADTPIIPSMNLAEPQRSVQSLTLDVSEPTEACVP